MEGDEEAPESCDCCGRDAEDCGIVELGWARDRRRLGFEGHYCLGCARLLRLTPWSAACARCNAQVENERQAELDGWGYFADTLGELQPYCPACLASQLGSGARTERPMT